jgi:hypothetical protein
VSVHNSAQALMNCGVWIDAVQNSHHSDYQSIGVISRPRCDHLPVKRLIGYLQ